ncbi:MAG: hypothetical protein ACI86M_001621 [Saprospiraceae bacterium]|jgi:hypothetical protein
MILEQNTIILFFIEKSIVQLDDELDRIKIVLKVQDSNTFCTWIEGIGVEEKGLLLNIDYWPDLRCVSSDNGDIYLAEGFSSEDCDARARDIL